MIYVNFFDNASPRGESGATVSHGCVKKEFRNTKKKIKIHFKLKGQDETLIGKTNIARLYFGPDLNDGKQELLDQVKRSTKLQAYVVDPETGDDITEYTKNPNTKSESQKKHTHVQATLAKHFIESDLGVYSPDKKLIQEYDGDLKLLDYLPEGVPQSNSLKQIDLIVFKDSSPLYLIEVERTTSISSGLSRMNSACKHIKESGFDAPKPFLYYNKDKEEKAKQAIENSKLSCISISHDFDSTYVDISLFNIDEDKKNIKNVSKLKNNNYIYEEKIVKDTKTKKVVKTKRTKKTKKVTKPKILTPMQELFQRTEEALANGNYQLKGDNSKAIDFNPYFEAIHWFQFNFWFQNDNKKAAKDLFKYIYKPVGVETPDLRGIQFPEFLKFLASIKK